MGASSTLSAPNGRLIQLFRKATLGQKFWAGGLLRSGEAPKTSESTRWSCSTPCEKRSARRPPDMRNAVVAGGDDAFTFGEEPHAGHAIAVAFVCAQLLAGCHVPDAHSAVASVTLVL